MEYFAGLFDAEGYVSLSPNGAFALALEISNEKIPVLFKEAFGGSIYSRQREKRKKSWTWRINSISSQCIDFINQISPHSIFKKPQLLTLKSYLDQSRLDRKNNREIFRISIKNYKTPTKFSLLQFHIPSTIEPSDTFFKWFAGFLDGDGNIVCNEYIDKRNGRKYFAHQLSVFNTFPEGIHFVKQRLEGNVRITQTALHPIYRWTCKREIEPFVCVNILPFLKLKKIQCELFLEFIKFPAKARNIDHSQEVRCRMYEIINQIKHLNSL